MSVSVTRSRRTSRGAVSGRQLIGLVMDLAGLVGQLGQVQPPVVSTKIELATGPQPRADIGPRPAAVAAICGAQTVDQGCVHVLALLSRVGTPACPTLAARADLAHQSIVGVTDPR